jgi:ArsR family transcriptional regulator
MRKKPHHAGNKPVSLDGLLRALADRTRLRLLNLMGDTELCVCYFVEVLQTSQPKISRHLAYLRRAGIVAARREGLWMHYRVIVPPDSHTAHILDEVRASLAHDPEMRRDRERLRHACRAPEKFVRLQSAPHPALVVAGTQERK